MSGNGTESRSRRRCTRASGRRTRRTATRWGPSRPQDVSVGAGPGYRRDSGDRAAGTRRRQRRGPVVIRRGGDDGTPTAEQTGVSYEDIGGLDEELDRIREMIEMPLSEPEEFRRLGIDPPSGVLLHGPPGTGKTLIARAVANEVDADFDDHLGPEVVSKYKGESEERLREAFEKAEANAPAILFVDEIDSIAGSRDEDADMENRVVAQLLTLMDGLEDRGRVVVIGATNRVDASTRRCAAVAASTARSKSASPASTAAARLWTSTRGTCRCTTTWISTGSPHRPTASSGPTSNRWPRRPRWPRSGRPR